LGQERQVKCYNCNENEVALDEEQLLFLAGGQDNAIDEDVDEKPAPTAQTMFMVNLSSANHVCDEAGLSYDSDILSEKQLTPEQIFWSQDLIKMKTEALKEQTTASRPIKALTVEMGFKQTKECYLKEVIPFFKTLKEHFEGIQKALTKEIPEMKDVFKELEAEVAQNVVDRKHDEIKRKNLPIANDNLIAECLSKEVFYVATNSELNVARFTKMHVANTIVEARSLELEAELSTLRDKSHNDNHNELVNRFSNLE
nr:hypothetical protein [Tanacetum cinerariifolium]